MGQTQNDPRFMVNGAPQRDEQGRVYATLGAGPEGWTKNTLVSDRNRPADRAPHQGGIVIQNPSDVKAGPLGPGDPVAEDQFIERLFQLDANYQDNVNYDLFPRPATDGYNSNSYAAGLLEAANADAPAPPVNSPGFNKPLPREHFQPRGPDLPAPDANRRPGRSQ